MKEKNQSETKNFKLPVSGAESQLFQLLICLRLITTNARKSNPTRYYSGASGRAYSSVV